MEHDEARGRLTGLVFLDNVPPPVQGLIVFIEGLGCGIGAVALVRLHEHLAARLAAGDALNPFETLIAMGSSIRTAWPGWVAGACFLFAVLRLRFTPPEPPAGLTSVERQTPAQIRRGLRREYLVGRIAVVVVVLLAALDGGRALATLLAITGGNEHDSAAVTVATIVEAAGYIFAALMLAFWTWTFGNQVRRLGAM